MTEYWMNNMRENVNFVFSCNFQRNFNKKYHFVNFAIWFLIVTYMCIFRFSGLCNRIWPRAILKQKKDVCGCGCGCVCVCMCIYMYCLFICANSNLYYLYSFQLMKLTKTMIESKVWFREDCVIRSFDIVKTML